MFIPSDELKRASTRGGGFAVAALMSGLATLLSAPLLIRSLGPGTWAQVATAQAVGAIACAVIYLGWQSSGPSLVAMNPERSKQLLAKSIKPRFLTLLLTLPLQLLALKVIFPDGPTFTLASVAIATSLPGVGCAWYFIGLAQPRRLIRYETIPLSAGVLIGASLTHLWPSVWTLSFSMISAGSLSILTSYASESGIRSLRATRIHERLNEPTPLDATLRHTLISSWAGMVTSYAPVLVTAALQPSELPMIALADRLFRLGLAAYSPVIQAMQGWVPSAGTHEGVLNRVRTSLSIASTWGVLVGLIGSWLLQSAGLKLTSGAIQIEAPVPQIYGVMYAILAVGQTTALVCLIPTGQSLLLAVSTGIGAAIAVVGSLVLQEGQGAVGILSAVLGAEFFAVGLQVVAVLRMSRNHRSGRDI